MYLVFGTLIAGFRFLMESYPVDRKKVARWQRIHILGYILFATGILGGIVTVLAYVVTIYSIPLIANIFAVLMVVELTCGALLLLLDLILKTAPNTDLSPVALTGAPFQSANEYIERGAERAKAGDISTAILDFSAAVALDPQNATAYFLRGKAYIRVDRIKASIDFKRVLELEPNHPQASTLRNFVNDAG